MSGAAPRTLENGVLGDFLSDPDLADALDALACDLLGDGAGVHAPTAGTDTCVRARR